MAVFAGSRIRDNNAFGTTTDNPLTNVATTINSAGLANLSAVASNHAVLVLDPTRLAGAPEIVIVTAHTGAATSATITRGAYGSVARSHASGTLWVLAPTVDDLIRICTSGTRPSDQYEGQLIYETDTDSYKAHNGTAWEHALTLGAWTSYTPTLTQSGAVTKTTTYGRYTKVGRTVSFEVVLTCTGAGTASNEIRVGLPPFTPVQTTLLTIGSGWVFDASVPSMFRGVVELGSATYCFLRPTVGTFPSGGLGLDQFTAALATGDIVSLNGVFEATA